MKVIPIINGMLRGRYFREGKKVIDTTTREIFYSSSEGESTRATRKTQ